VNNVPEYYTHKKEVVCIPVGTRQLPLVNCATEQDAKIIANMLNVYKAQVDDERSIRELAIRHCTCEDDGK
jgi:hypothetical protein